MNRRVVVTGAVLAAMAMMAITLAGVFVAASAVSAALDESSADPMEAVRMALADTAAAQADEDRGATQTDESDDALSDRDSGDRPDSEDVERVIRKSLQLGGMAEGLLGEPLSFTVVAAGEDGEVPLHMSEGIIDWTGAAGWADWTDGGACGALEGAEDEVGVLVTGVVPDSAAAEAGLARGDIILAVDGQAVDDTLALHDALSELEIGQAVTLEVLHGDEARTLSTAMGECEEHPFLGVRLMGSPMSVHVFDGDLHGDLHGDLPGGLLDGLHGDLPDGLPDGLAGLLPHIEILELDGDGLPHDIVGGLLEGLDGDLQGLVVLDVVDDSAAESAGIEQGDVILGIDGSEVTGPDTLSDAVGALAVGDTLTLTVRRAGDDEAQELELDVALGESPDDPGRAFAGIVAAYVEAHIDDDGEGERRIRIDAMPGSLTAPGMPAIKLVGPLGASDRLERGLELAKEIVGDDE